MNNENVSVLVITGSYPPDVCGMGDSTLLMKRSLESHGGRIYYTQNWKFNNIINIIHDIYVINPHAINMQYPTLWYGWSLVPHLICIWFSLFSKIKFAVTLHEFSEASVKYKFCAYIFLFFSNKIIFTNEFERIKCSKYLKFVFKKSQVVKTCSNIAVGTKNIPIRARKIDIVYFGHFKPHKGIEAFLDIIEEVRKIDNNIKITMIGQVFSSYTDFYENILLKSASLNIDVRRDLPVGDVACMLSDSKIALLPYPDGVSERRGTLFAAVKNSCIIVTTRGKYTTNDLDDISLYLPESNRGLFVCSILNRNDVFYMEKQNKIVEYQKSLPSTWDEVECNIRKYVMS